MPLNSQDKRSLQGPQPEKSWPPLRFDGPLLVETARDSILGQQIQPKGVPFEDSGSRKHTWYECLNGQYIWTLWATEPFLGRSIVYKGRL